MKYFYSFGENHPETNMSQYKLWIAILCMAPSISSCAQTPVKEIKAGHIFYISLPDYMTRTTGLNAASTIQFKNTVKDVAGFVVEDSKEELALAEINYSSITEFYDDFIKDFLVDQEKRNISKPVAEKKGNVNFISCDASYVDSESKMEIYYFVGIAETKDTYYKLLCFGGADSREKYRKDFENILFSIRD